MDVQWHRIRTIEHGTIAGGIILEVGWPDARAIAIRDMAGSVHDLDVHHHLSHVAPLGAVVHELRVRSYKDSLTKHAATLELLASLVGPPLAVQRLCDS